MAIFIYILTRNAKNGIRVITKHFGIIIKKNTFRKIYCYNINIYAG